LRETGMEKREMSRTTLAAPQAAPIKFDPDGLMPQTTWAPVLALGMAARVGPDDIECYPTSVADERVRS